MLSEIRTVVTDMDGTLLAPGALITPRTRQAVDALREHGIGLILASGRGIFSMSPYVRDLGITYPFIACNGAQIADPKDMWPIYEDLIPLELTRRISLQLEQIGCYFQLYYGDYFYFSMAGQYDEQYTKDTGTNGIWVERLSDFAHQPTPKILIIGPEREAAELHDRLKLQYEGILTVTRSNRMLVEITTQTANKGTALLYLLRSLGIDPKSVLALGDGLNDIPMLRAAGASVAMGSALDEVRRAATHHALPNTQDGWAEFVFAELLPREERP